MYFYGLIESTSARASARPSLQSGVRESAVVLPLRGHVRSDYLYIFDWLLQVEIWWSPKTMRNGAPTPFLWRFRWSSDFTWSQVALMCGAPTPPILALSFFVTRARRGPEKLVPTGGHPMRQGQTSSRLLPARKLARLEIFLLGTFFSS